VIETTKFYAIIRFILESVYCYSRVAIDFRTIATQKKKSMIGP